MVWRKLIELRRRGLQRCRRRQGLLLLLMTDGRENSLSSRRWQDWKDSVLSIPAHLTSTWLTKTLLCNPVRDMGVQLVDWLHSRKQVTYRHGIESAKSVEQLRAA